MSSASEFQPSPPQHSARSSQQQRLDPPHSQPAAWHGVSQPAFTTPPKARARRAVGESLPAIPEQPSSGARPANTTPATPDPADRGTAENARRAALHAAWQRRSKQAEELADHLRERLAEADRREAELNAREAELDHRERQFQFWLEAREAEVNDAQVALQAEQETLRIAQDDLRTQEAAWGQQREEATAALEEQISIWKEHRAACEQAESATSQAREELTREARRQQQRHHAREERLRRGVQRVLRRGELNRRETELLRQQQRQLVAQVEVFERSRLQAHESTQRHFDDQRTNLKRRAHQLDQLHRELQRQFDRLAAEKQELTLQRYAMHDLWRQICEREEQAQADRRLHRLRLELHEHFQHQLRELRRREQMWINRRRAAELVEMQEST